MKSSENKIIIKLLVFIAKMVVEILAEGKEWGYESQEKELKKLKKESKKYLGDE